LQVNKVKACLWRVLDQLVERFEIGTTSIDVGQDSPIGLCTWVAGVRVLGVVEHIIFILFSMGQVQNECSTSFVSK
jgi:hypothetical protein